MFLEKLLAKEDIEAGVSLVRNIDDVGVLSLLFLTFHSLILRSLRRFNNNASALWEAPY